LAVVRVGWFQVVVGAGILLLWPVLIVAGEVPELEAGQRDIWFHIAAEVVTGALLVVGGTSLLRGGATGARVVSAVALGALLYTGINSAGYYAELGQWLGAVLLVGVAVGAGCAVLVLLRTPAPSVERVAARARPPA
jgi:hypothetical protein